MGDPDDQSFFPGQTSWAETRATPRRRRARWRRRGWAVPAAGERQLLPAGNAAGRHLRLPAGARTAGGRAPRSEPRLDAGRDLHARFPRLLWLPDVQRAVGVRRGLLVRGRPEQRLHRDHHRALALGRPRGAALRRLVQGRRRPDHARLRRPPALLRRQPGHLSRSAHRPPLADHADAEREQHHLHRRDLRAADLARDRLARLQRRRAPRRRQRVRRPPLAARGGRGDALGEHHAAAELLGGLSRALRIRADRVRSDLSPDAHLAAAGDGAQRRARAPDPRLARHRVRSRICRPLPGFDRDPQRHAGRVRSGGARPHPRRRRPLGVRGQRQHRLAAGVGELALVEGAAAARLQRRRHLQPRPARSTATATSTISCPSGTATSAPAGSRARAATR